MSAPRSTKQELRQAELSILEAGDVAAIHALSQRTQDDVVLRAIAVHPATSPLTLRNLSLRNKKLLRKKLVTNPKTPYGTLRQLERLGYDVPEHVLHEAARIELSLGNDIDVEGIAGSLLIEMLGSDDI